MRRKVLIVALALAGVRTAAQPGPDGPVFHATSTMVTVPALVRDSRGEFVTSLEADDFTLYDNGVPQSLKLANIEHEPIALVVVMQTGGAAHKHFLDSTDLPLFLDWLTAGTNHELMLVTFDSRVEMTWHFPVRSDGLVHSLTHPHAGDEGAALVDAVQLAVEQLQSEPGNFRRIVLLVSQEKDAGSVTLAEEALLTLGKGSTAIYSLTFSVPATKRKSKNLRDRGINPPNPFATALSELRENTASTMAAYTGGAHWSFSTRREFDEAIKALGTDLRNRYTLGFQPAPHQPGFHKLGIEVPGGLTVRGRGGYWFDPASPSP